MAHRILIHLDKPWGEASNFAKSSGLQLAKDRASQINAAEAAKECQATVPLLAKNCFELHLSPCLAYMPCPASQAWMALYRCRALAATSREKAMLTVDRAAMHRKGLW